MLNKINFKSLYSSGENDSPISFFTDALSNSISFDFGLGFFSSASFNVLSIRICKIYLKRRKDAFIYKPISFGGRL